MHKAGAVACPGDIRTRDLVYGIGGREHVPHGPFTFVKEDLRAAAARSTTCADRDGVKWKVKLGQEAKPETAATRIVWAAGYFTGEDYYLPDIQVKGVPAKLHRGRQWVDPGRHHARRAPKAGGARKRSASGGGRAIRFIGTREFNGLRTVMGADQ